MPIFYSSENLKIWCNPTQGFVRRLTGQSEGDVRALLAGDGKLFVWDGNEATHSQVEDDIGIGGLRLDLRDGCVNVVLAGGALELLDAPEKVAAFFSRYGHHGATLDDVTALAEIADRECARARSASSLRRAMPGEADYVADIDPRVDWAAVTLARLRRWQEQSSSPAPGRPTP